MELIGFLNCLNWLNELEKGKQLNFVQFDIGSFYNERFTDQSAGIRIRPDLFFQPDRTGSGKKHPVSRTGPDLETSLQNFNFICFQQII